MPGTHHSESFFFAVVIMIQMRHFDHTQCSLMIGLAVYISRDVFNDLLFFDIFAGFFQIYQQVH